MVEVTDWPEIYEFLCVCVCVCFACHVEERESVCVKIV